VPITYPVALFYGLLQGASELFPISSLGHAVVLPPLLHISVRESDPSFLPFLVLLHIGTATALIVIYWRQWVRIIAGFVRSVISGRVSGGDERLAWLLVVGTIPAGLVGITFQKSLQNLFADPRLAAALLIVNGVVLLAAEMLRRRDERRAGSAHAGGIQHQPGAAAGGERVALGAPLAARAEMASGAAFTSTAVTPSAEADPGRAAGSGGAAHLREADPGGAAHLREADPGGAAHLREAADPRDALDAPGTVAASRGDGERNAGSAPGAGMLRQDPALEARRYHTAEEMSFWSAALVGVCQVFALFPGISRSGATMAGALVAGLRHEEALRFSFLLATPIILAAGLLELPSLAGVPGLGAMLVGGIAAGLVAYASARFLIRYFRFGRLDPYAYYCVALGVVGVILLT
jgi:undecaprenyl-diphosphatase